MKSVQTTFVRLMLVFAAIAAAAQEIRRAIPVNPPVAARPAQVAPASPAVATRDRIRLPGVPLSRQTVPRAVGPASVNDTAHFSPGCPFRSRHSSFRFAQTGLAATRRFLRPGLGKTGRRQFAGIRNWEANYLPDATQPIPVVLLYV